MDILITNNEEYPIKLDNIGYFRERGAFIDKETIKNNWEWEEFIDDLNYVRKLVLGSLINNQDTTMKKDIEVTPYGKVWQDESQRYFVHLIGEFTVREFIDKILEKFPNEKGEFYMDSNTSQLGYIFCKYWEGSITSDPFPDDILNSKIKSVSGYGGWTVSNYKLEIEKCED